MVMPHDKRQKDTKVAHMVDSRPMELIECIAERGILPISSAKLQRFTLARRLVERGFLKEQVTKRYVSMFSLSYKGNKFLDSMDEFRWDWVDKTYTHNRDKGKQI